MKKFWKYFWRILLILFGILFLSGFIFLMVIILQAPDIDEVDATPSGYLTTIYDDTGLNVLDTLADSESNRVYVDLEDIPKSVQHAFVAIEDERFYTHHGIDLKGIARAFVKGVTNGFHFSEGASTITQQLLKNNVFTDWMEEETFYDKLTRKIQEQYLAVQLEFRYSKDWILENYLNTINLGGGTRGIEVASQYYFGEDVRQLTLAQAALIAGITKSPSAYNPFKHPDASLKRQKIVLEAMKEQGYLTETEYEEALAEDVISELDVNHETQTAKIFSWFEDALLNSIVEDLEDTYGYDEDKAWDVIYSGGLKIYSTENATLQGIVDAAVADPSYFADDSQQTSVVMMDTTTGAVTALSGGRGEKTASLVYDRATDAVRQPGSTIKIIGEYAAGLDSGAITLGTTFDDAPYTYSDGTEIHNSDDRYRGQTTVKDAIILSDNIIALKTFRQVGVDNVFDYLTKFGITTLSEEDKNEPLAIGGTYHGVTNLELAAAYNTIARGGLYIKPFYYSKIVNHDGNVILTHESDIDSDSTRVISKDTASLLTLAMEEVMTLGTGQEAYFEGTELAGKSGTTNDMRDLWFVGFSPNYTLSIWGGYDDNTEQADSSYVKRLWGSIMQQVQAGIPAGELNISSNLVRAAICTKCGRLAIDGVCDNTVQGDMTRQEWFKEGTQPTAKCNCHVQYTLCSSSGRIANSYCPAYSRYTVTYLKEATPGTEDESYVTPLKDSDICTVHQKSSFNWFGSGSSGSNSNSGTNSGSDSGNSSGSQDNTWGSGNSGSDNQNNTWGSNNNDNSTGNDTDNDTDTWGNNSGTGTDSGNSDSSNNGDDDDSDSWIHWFDGIFW